MRHCGRAWAVAALVGCVVFAGCGDDGTTGEVTVDHGKDPKLMDAMKGYMDKRAGSKGAKSKAPASPPAESSAEPPANP